jgi:hypothetical protein
MKVSNLFLRIFYVLFTLFSSPFIFNLTYLDAYLSYLDALELVIIDQQQVTNNSTGKESYSKKYPYARKSAFLET